MAADQSHCLSEATKPAFKTEKQHNEVLNVVSIIYHPAPSKQTQLSNVSM